MEVSFIIPIYNMERYLQRCLDSVLAVKSVEWECILIDDGSTDGSWEIICGYTSKYPDRFAARHKENGGVSSAKNMGLELVSGDRIMFLDPDDYLFPNAGSVLRTALDKYGDTDQIMFKYLKVYDDGRTENSIIGSSGCTDYDDMIFKNVLLGDRAAFCCIQLFKASIIKEYNIRFETGMRLSEDMNFSLDYIMRSRSYIDLDEYIYAYYQRVGSAVRQHRESDWQDFIKYIDKRFELIEYRKMKLSKNQLRDVYFYNFRVVVGHFIDVYSGLPLREFKIKCKEILSLPEIADIIDKSTKYVFLYFFVKRRIYTLFWLAARALKLLQKLQKR